MVFKDNIGEEVTMKPIKKINITVKHMIIEAEITLYVNVFLINNDFYLIDLQYLLILPY